MEIYEKDGDAYKSENVNKLQDEIIDLLIKAHNTGFHVQLGSAYYPADKLAELIKEDTRYLTHIDNYIFVSKKDVLDIMCQEKERLLEVLNGIDLYIDSLKDDADLNQRPDENAL